MSLEDAGGATARLEGYLADFRTRLKRMRVARGAAALAAAALAITVVGVALAIRAGFEAEVFIVTRVLLVAVLALLAAWLIVLPLRRIKGGAIDQIEARTPELAGRVETYAGMRDKGNPFIDLLAEDTLAVATDHPVERQVKPLELTVPAAIGGLCVAALLWLAIAGPGLFSYGVRHLWAGWAVSNLLPAQSIAVTPGDEAVRRGGSVPLLAEMKGFDPASATVHARMGDGDWQEVDMARTDRGFEFTFFSVREPVEYFVAAAGTRSPSYKVAVVDLPSVGNLKLTLNFPGWTGRPPQVQDPGGDISTVSGTGVDLEITADAPLPAAELVLNDKAVPMTTDGVNGKTKFDVKEDGRYYVAARVGSEQVRLTEDYFIKILPDGKPEIRLSRPGRDWNASSIEEVTAHLEATDDYALSALELHYAVNGGEWQTVKLPVGGREAKTDHVLALESMRTTELGKEGTRPLAPGDLISYYAVAKDRRQTAQTDMFFIDVRPFDRRYTQSQAGGGGGGGGGGGQESEISQRQREIIVSTWNLLREPQTREGRSGTVRDNATLLSELQKTLSGQARTLAERANARELSADPQIKTFVENMTKAAEAMDPASQRLAAIDLEKAIQPEQQALQYLLRAEAAFNDVQVAMQQGGGGGGGGQAGRDLADMLEIEMDLEKNQYETGNPASMSADSGEQKMDEIARKLQELARRQEQLAANARQQQQLTAAQRWQQESLRREAEELRRQVENLQRQASNGQQGQPGQQSGQQSGQGGQPGQQGQSGQQRGQQQAAQRLESAIRAMNEASEAMQNGEGGSIDREKLNKASGEAQRQLAQARDEVARQQQQSLQNSLSSMASRAGDLYEKQRAVDQELQESVRKLLAERSNNRAQSGLSDEQETRLAAVTSSLGEGLDRLERDITSSARSLAPTDKPTAATLEDAAKDLCDSQLQARLAIAADYIRRGGAAFVAGSESAVTDGLRDLRDQLRRAESMAGGPGQQQREDAAESALSRIQELRRELQQLANSAQQGNGQRGEGQQPGQGAQGQQSGDQGQGQGQKGQGQQGQGQQGQGQGQQGQGQGQQGQGQGQGQAGNQPGQGSQGATVANNGGNQGGQNGGAVRGGAYGNGGNAVTGGLGPVGGGWRGSWWDRPATGSTPVDVRDDMRRDIAAASREVRDALPELDQRGVSDADLDALRKLASQIEQARFQGGSQVLERELKANLALLEQLELRLSQGMENRGTAKVRTAVADRVPEEYKDAVAEYYRRLSKEKQTPR